MFQTSIMFQNVTLSMSQVNSANVPMCQACFKIEVQLSFQLALNDRAQLPSFEALSAT